MSNKKQLKLAAAIDGVGFSYSSWRHPDMPADVGENIDFYLQQAHLVEAAKFETLLTYQ